MRTFLTQPYPVRDPRFSRALVQALLSGTLISFILVMFQPFGSYTWQHPYKHLILAGFGLVAVVVNLIDFVVTRKLGKTYFRESSWNVWKEILRNMLGFVLAGFLCVVYGYIFGLMPFTLSQISYMIAICFLVGALPAIILTLLNYAYLTHKYSKPLAAPQPTKPEPASAEELLELVAENGKDILAIPVQDLLYIAASDNYCTVFYTQGDILRKELLRSSLSRLESQIATTRIARCHRSYLVNIDRIRTVTGNAQGYKLHLDAASEPVPVSRSYTSLLKEQQLVC